MKKITLAIFSIFALTACSGDVYYDIDKQNNGLETGNNPDSEGSGGNAPFTIAPDYESLWDINTRGQHEMWYRFDNWTGDWGSAARLDFRITPYVGLAYYDGTPDGIYNDTYLGPPAVENFNLVHRVHTPTFLTPPATKSAISFLRVLLFWMVRACPQQPGQ